MIVLSTVYCSTNNYLNSSVVDLSSVSGISGFLLVFVRVCIFCNLALDSLFLVALHFTLCVMKKGISVSSISVRGVAWCVGVVGSNSGVGGVNGAGGVLLSLWPYSYVIY